MSKVTFHVDIPRLSNRFNSIMPLRGGLHKAMGRAFMCSRVMGMFPLSGAMSPSSEMIKYTLKSPYSIYFVVTVLGQLLMCAMSSYWVYFSGFSLTNITNLTFYSSSLISVLFLSNIGRCWPQLLAKVEDIERKLPPFTRDLPRICNVAMYFLLFFAIVEHLTSVYYGITVARACDSDDMTRSYFKYNMPWIFTYTKYAWWKGTFIELFNIQSTFMWSYNDLLIIIISIYLTEHLKVHNQMLKKALKRDYFSCEVFRRQYLLIVRIVRLFNGMFGVYIVTSIAGNFFWICMQLFYSLKISHTGHVVACQFKNRSKNETLHGVEHGVYFTCSFSFLVTRTLLVLLFAARVHAKSKASLGLLYDLPTSRYDVEVERYIDQINNLKVALSGLDFFYVTRTMILTLLGTIITYELVLLQFNQ